MSMFLEPIKQEISNKNYIDLFTIENIKIIIIFIVLIGFFRFLWKIFFSKNKEENDKYIIAVIEIIVMIIWIFVLKEITMLYFITFGIIILLSLKKDWFFKIYTLIAWAWDWASKFLENHHKDKKVIQKKSEKISDDDLGAV